MLNTDIKNYKTPSSCNGMILRATPKTIHINEMQIISGLPNNRSTGSSCKLF